jgi:cytochrome c
MLRRRYLLGAATALIGCSGRVMAADANGAPDQAKAMVEGAASLIEKDGNDKAFAIIDDPSGPFVKGNMYVFVTSFDGVTLAHGTNKVLVGKSMIQVKDADGKLFVQEMIDVAKSKGEGWVDYKWPNPVTHKIEAKTTFLKRVGDELVGCGIYKG